jgi:hypothetical protein
MSMIMDRPTTPPPSSPTHAYLLTPPPTATFDKRITLDEGLVDEGSSRRILKSKEGESPTSFFEGSDVEAGESSDLETIPSSQDSVPASPVSGTSSSTKDNALNDDVLFSSLAVAPSVTKPFPFLKLPLSVRNKIYEHLLVIPALICVRQKRTVSEDQQGAHLHSERRELIPGIAYALPQLTVNGYKVTFSRFASTNSNILLASKEIYAEARAILYGKNNFDIAKPSTELSPPTDSSVRLFPSGCQRLVTKLCIRIRSFYDLHWLFSGGYNLVKNYYRGINTLTLILELQSTDKGFGRQWARAEGEKEDEYVARLQNEVTKGFSGAAKAKKAVKVPAWIKLRVMFSGESYNAALDGSLNSVNSAQGDGAKQVRREELREGLMEAWESFRKGGR